MQSLDHFRITWILEEVLQKLNFLSKVPREDGASSELAEYEINKSLGEQMQLEAKYAELLKIRGTLKGISNKRKLEEIQEEILRVAHTLKENTKKLGRLFRENPSFEKDAEKVGNEKAELVDRLENIVNVSFQNFSLVNIQSALIDDLETQDYLRKQSLKEQNLIQETKQIHALMKKEEEEFQNIITEKQAHIQQQKENFAKHQAETRMETQSKQNELAAKEGTDNRLQGQRISDLQKKIEEAEVKKAVEIQAFKKISSFLKQKEEENKAKKEEWTFKFENSRSALETRIENLNTQKEKALAKLEKLKEQYNKADSLRKEKEKKREEKDEEIRKRNDEETKLDEAIKAIQEHFNLWKENGGTVKKAKKGKGKKGSKK